MTIYGTIENLKQSANAASIGDIIAIVVAVISLFGVLISTIWTNNTTKKINKDNEKFQETWNQKQIDASLKASARIEWIQEVRHTTSELIALYLKVINASSKEGLLETVVMAQEKTELLILFFGPESRTISNIDLLCTSNNDNKNGKIVEFLSSLSKRLYQYYKSIENNELENLSALMDHFYNDYVEHIVGYDHEERENEEYGYKEYEEIPIFDREYQEKLNNTLQKKGALEKNLGIHQDLLKLRDIIRIYLKIEWNKAKKGE